MAGISDGSVLVQSLSTRGHFISNTAQHRGKGWCRRINWIFEPFIANNKDRDINVLRMIEDGLIV